VENTFILDENIIIASLKCSPMANQLLINISTNFHQLALHTDLSRKYWSILKKYKNSVHHTVVQRYIGDILHDSSRCNYLVGPFRDQNQIPLHHRNDLFLAQIAFSIEGTCIIVSSDKKTLQDLNRLGLKAIPLHEAIKLSS
jgi:hypothetical protein